MLNYLTDAATTQSLVDFSQFDLSGVLPTLTAGIAAVSGITISCILLRKGWGFIKSSIRKA